MKKPDLPADEAARLKALHRLNLVDSPGEERFDRLTRLARQIFSTRWALVTLVDTDRQFFLSCAGNMGTDSTSREVSFCGHTILGSDVMVVEDALEDPRFSDNPLVTESPFIRFYAGAPLRSAEGFRLGALCLIDDQPLPFSKDSEQILRDLADLVEEQVNREQAEEQQKLVAEREQLDRLARVARGTAIGQVVSDREQRVRWVNPAFEAMSGLAAATLRGQQVVRIMAGERTERRVMTRAEELLAEGKTLNCEILQYHQSGKPFWCHVRAEPVHLDSVFEGYQWLFMDISAMRQSEQGAP